MDDAASVCNSDIARKMLEHLSAMNIDAISSLLHEDAVLEMPFAPGGDPLIVSGRDAVLEVFRGAPENFDVFRIVPHEVWECPSRDTVIVEATSLGRYKNGRFYQNRYGLVFQFRDGRVTLFREYSNPFAMAA